MSPKLIIFIIGFLYLAGAGIVNPIMGIIGYMLQYMLGAELKWWHAPLNPLGIRYSLTFAVIIAVGIYMNQNRIRYGRLLIRQENIVLAMLALIWLLSLAGQQITDRYTVTDTAAVKMTKVMIFCLMFTHVVTNSKDMDKIFWLFVAGGLFLGLQAWDLPRSAFTGGRLDGRVGGTDFRDANALAAFMAAATITTGIMFMRSSWRGKILCLAAGAFSMNTIVLCRSRGAMLGLCGAGIAILFSAPKRYRIHLAVAMAVAMAGMLYLSDPQFIARIGNIVHHADAVIEGQVTSDRSTMMRIEAWRGGLKMLADHPFGVGPGRFNQNISTYAPDIPGLSPHSLYIQVLAELGYIGMIILLVILGNALWTLRQISLRSGELPEPLQSDFQWSTCCISGIICAYMTFGITAHLMYVEAFWWFFMMPAALHRALDNALEDMNTAKHSNLTPKPAAPEY